MKRSILLMLLLSLTACGEVHEPTRQDREAQAQQKYNELQVTKLFTENGCDVYRFHDMYEYRYFTTCLGGTSSTHSVNQGKTKRTVYEDVPTGVMQ